MDDKSALLIRVKKSMSLGDLILQNEETDQMLKEVAHASAVENDTKVKEEQPRQTVTDPKRAEVYDANTGEILEDNMLVGEGIVDGEGVNLEPGPGISREARAIQHARENYGRPRKSDYHYAPENDYDPRYNAIYFTEGRAYPPERTAKKVINGETRPPTARRTLGVPQFVMNDALGTAVNDVNGEDLLDYATHGWEDKEGKPKELSDNWKRSLAFILQAIASYRAPGEVESDRRYNMYEQDHYGVTHPGNGIRVNDWADNIAQSLGYPSRDEYLQRYAAPIFISAASRHLAELAKDDPRVLLYMQEPELDIGGELSKQNFWDRYYDAPPLLRRRMREKTAESMTRKLAYVLYKLDKDWLGNMIHSSRYDRGFADIAQAIEDGEMDPKDLIEAFRGGLTFDLGAMAEGIGNYDTGISDEDIANAFRGKVEMYGNKKGKPVLSTRTLPFDIYTLFKEEDMAPDYGGYDEAQGDVDAFNKYRTIAEMLNVDPMDFEAVANAISDRLGTAGFSRDVDKYGNVKSMGLAAALGDTIKEIIRDNRRVDAPLARALKARYPDLSDAAISQILYQLRSPENPGRYYDYNADGAISEDDIRAAVRDAKELDDEYTGPTNSQLKAYGTELINALYQDLQDDPLWENSPASLRDQLRYLFYRHPDDKYGVKYKDAVRGGASDPDFGTIDTVTETGPDGVETTRDVRRIYDSNGKVDPRYANKIKKWAEYANAYLDPKAGGDFRQKLKILAGGMSPEVVLKDGTVIYPPDIDQGTVKEILSELKRRNPDAVFPDKDINDLTLHQVMDFIQNGGLDNVTSTQGTGPKEVVKDYIKYGWDEILPIIDYLGTDNLSKLVDAGLIKLRPDVVSSLLGRDISAEALSNRGSNLDVLQNVARAMEHRNDETIEKENQDENISWYLPLLRPAMDILSQYVNWDTGADLPITDEEARKKKDMAVKLLTSYAGLHPDLYEGDFEASSFADDSPGDIYRFLNGQKVLPSQTLYSAYNVMNARQKAKKMLREAEDLTNKADYSHDPESASIWRDEAKRLTGEANKILENKLFSADKLDYANRLIAYPAEQRVKASEPKEMSREEEYQDKDENDMQSIQDTVNAWIDNNFEEDDPAYKVANELAQRAIWTHGDDARTVIKYLEDTFMKVLKSMPSTLLMRKFKGKERQSMSFAKSSPESLIRRKRA